MNQIKPYPLWIGHAGDGRAFQMILDRGIRAVVQLAIEEPPPQPPRELTFLRFPIVDGVGNDPDVLRLAIRSVGYVLQREIPTLVTCGAGLSRSPVIVAAALALITSGDVDECLKLVAEGHPADISPGFLAEVADILQRRPEFS